MPRLRHTTVHGVHARDRCPACCRNDDAVDTFSGAFGCLVFFTAVPVTPVLVVIADDTAGRPAAVWTAALLAVSPFLVSAVRWVWDDRRPRP